MRQLTTISLASMLALSLLLSACGTPTPTPTATGVTTPAPTITTPPRATPTPTAAATVVPKTGGTMRIITGQTTTVLGYPAQMSGPARSVAVATLQTLLEADNEGRTIAGLATSWQIASDMKSITFTLRKGVKFHDGMDFNAIAVKWNLDRMMAAKIEGTEAWDTITVIDDYTFRLNLKRLQNT